MAVTEVDEAADPFGSTDPRERLGGIRSSRGPALPRGRRSSSATADPVVRWHATVALGDIGHRDGLETLVAVSEGAIPFVRAHAAIGLGQLGAERGLEAVERSQATSSRVRRRWRARRSGRSSRRVRRGAERSGQRGGAWT